MTQSSRQRDCVHAELTRLLDPTLGPLGKPPREVEAFLTEDLRDEVAEEYRAMSPDAPADGRAAIITAGPPGAGKSTALDVLLDEHRRIDPDAVKDLLLGRLEAAGLLEVRHGFSLLDGQPVRPGELAWWVHRASTDVADLVRLTSLARGENFAMEGTLVWDEIVGQYNGELLRSGYETLIVLDVEVSLPVAIEQARQRWWQGRGDLTGVGGRFVPDAVVAAFYPDNSKVSVCATRAREMYSEANDSGITTTLALESRGISGARSAALLRPTGDVEAWRGLTLAAVCVRCGSRLTGKRSINRGLGEECHRHTL